ncbi:MAG: ABC transporter ATP-binding protein [Chloroflexi bacterium]|nr:ABC transporter ATP-binding protein [Chloroflexota bacterium]
MLVLLGPSGCGKSTTLRLIAGLENPDIGSILLNGREVAGESVWVTPEQRRVGLVFQDYALFPHLSVIDNVTFGLRGLASRERQARAAAMLDLVGLADLGDRMPHQLSGGQQQRVALARAIAPQPEILLLDEPFSNLDAALRAQVRAEIRAILKQTGITSVFVTHDQEEALSLGDVVAVMLDGEVVQIADPQTLYTRPVNRRVASFVGEANFVSGTATSTTVETALGRLPLVTAASGPVSVLIRPEALHIVPADAPANQAAVVAARVQWREFYGHDQRVGVALESDPGVLLTARVPTTHIYSDGEPVSVQVGGAVIAFADSTAQARISDRA